MESHQKLDRLITDLKVILKAKDILLSSLLFLDTECWIFESNITIFPVSERMENSSHDLLIFWRKQISPELEGTFK